ncbi:MAG: conjugal transfer protein TraG [Alphaproteobacteria bacterium HGW-Alphaproteobacteria-18]|nr:MAG: conjugal transfer protein TraG [Alphaproteobacteria bacterium HGW-Alphaproteobacteria-18]
MRLVKAGTACILIIGLASSAATQFIASVFEDHPALGPRLAVSDAIAIYPPWAILGWSAGHAEDYPRPFKLAHAILFTGGLTALAPLALLMKPGRSQKPFGAAAWGNFEDARGAGLFAASGTVLGRFAGEILCHDGPGHQLLIGASRAGKGRGHIVPTLLAWGGSALVLDVKGELATGDPRHGFPGTAGFRETLGPVLCLAPTKPSSASFNPLLEVRRGTDEVRDVQNIVEIITDPAGDGRHSDFWDKSARQVMTGVILHVLYAEPLPRKTLAIVREKLRDLKSTCEEIRVTLHRVSPVTGQPEVHPEVLHGATSFLAGEERLQAGLKATAESFFGLFADPLVAERTSKSDFRLADLMCHEAPVTLYLQPPPSDAARLMPLMRLFLNQLARSQMEDLAHGSDGREKRHTLLLCLDEFPQLGKMPFFETAMGAFAGYGLKAYLVCQSLNHILRAYGRDNVILDNCHIVTAFAAADMNTAKTIAEMAGEARELRPQYSEQRPGPILGPRRGSVTWREESRPLLLPSDVRQLPPGEQLTFVAGTKPLRTRKIKYDREPVFAGRLRRPSGTPQRLTTAHDWEDVVSLGRLPASEKPARPGSPARPAPRKPAPSSQGDLFRQSGPSLSEQALAGFRPPQGWPDKPDPPPTVPGKRPRRRTGI